MPPGYQLAVTATEPSTGATSDSIDVVVFDRMYSPLVFVHNSFKYIPAEAVYAVFEAKQDINATHIEYAGVKAASVRRLTRTSAPVADIRGQTPTKPPIPILAGLVATELGWKADNAVGHVQRLLAAQPEPKQLELLCAADSLAFEAQRTGEEFCLASSAAETGLLFFMFGLLRRLQQVGTVAPIDFSAYRGTL